MKKNSCLWLFILLLCFWCPLFMGLFDQAKPAASTSLRNSNPEILTNWSDLVTAINQDHEFVNAASGQQSGEHTQIKFLAPISTPTNAANKGWLYSKDVSSVVELHWLDESGNELQMTSAGDLYSSAGLTVTTNATFNGGITLGAGDDLIGSSTSDITINTNKFTVAGATGNTVVAGTLTTTGNSTFAGTLGITGVATLGDSSQMATSAAPTVDADLANKKYVDDSVKGAAPTANDSESNAMLKAHAYLSQTAGYVSAIMTVGNTDILKGYVHTTNDPAGAGTLIQQSGSDSSSVLSITFFVPNGFYFEITHTSQTPSILWTPLISGGAAPVDQD